MTVHCKHKPVADRRPLDFYPTPSGLTIELLNTGLFSNCKTILEPCYGKGAITNLLEEKGFNVVKSDILYGTDFLKEDTYKGEKFDAVITNPPFLLFEKFLTKSLTLAPKVALICSMLILGSLKYQALFKNLSYVYTFNRKPLFEDEERERLKCGAMQTAWFIWDEERIGKPCELHILDIQKYF